MRNELKSAKIPRTAHNLSKVLLLQDVGSSAPYLLTENTG